MKWSKPDDQGIAVAKYDKTGSDKDMPSGKASNETSKDADTWRGIKKVKEEIETDIKHLRKLNHPNIVQFR